MGRPALVGLLLRGCVWMACVGVAALTAPPPARAASELERLLDAMGGAAVDERYPAYRELLTRRDPAIVGPLLERIGGYDLSAQSHYEPAAATGASRGQDLARLLDARSPFLRAAAAQQLHPQQPAKASKVLVEALAQARTDPGALQMILARLGGLKDQAVQAAARGFVAPESSSEILGAALSHLSYAGDTEVLPQVRALLRHADVGSRALAAAFLLKHGEEDQVSVLGGPWGRRFHARSGYGSWLEGARVGRAPSRRPPSASSERTYLLVADRVLAELEHAPAVPVMRRLLKSKEAVVAKAAFDALATLPNGLTVEDLEAELGGEDAVRRLAAADALRRRDDLRGLPAVLELAKAGSAQRAEAVRVLGGFRVDAAVEPLLEALLDDDVSTRANAYNGLGGVLRALLPYRRLDLASTGYATQADATVRAQGVARLRAWWQAARTKTW
jgi:HEAT repeat protein